jgi:hypothetical protein
VFGRCGGYASPTAASEVKPRLPQEVVLHPEVNDATGEQAHRIACDALIGAFSARTEWRRIRGPDG